MSVKVQKKNKGNKKAKILRDSARHKLCVGEDCPKKGTAALITANEAVSLYAYRKIIT